MLIAGFGSIGRRHLQNLIALGCQKLVLLRSGKSTLPDSPPPTVPVETSLDAALAHRPKIAIIANPTSEHIPTALAAAEAGCDLYIEKPLSHTIDGCDVLRKRVAELKLVAMVGCQFRFHPLLVSLKNQLEGGRIGRICGVRVEWGEYLPNWHPWEDHRRSYTARADLGGGVMLTLIHPFDYLCWMFGEVVRVHAMVARVPSLETQMGEDLTETTLEFGNGIVGQVHLDYLQRPATHTIKICGDQGRAICDFQAGSLRWESKDGVTETEEVASDFERNTMFVAAMKHFLDCVNRRVEPMVSLDESQRVLELVLRAKATANKEFSAC